MSSCPRCVNVSLTLFSHSGRSRAGLGSSDRPGIGTPETAAPETENYDVRLLLPVAVAVAVAVVVVVVVVIVVVLATAGTDPEVVLPDPGITAKIEARMARVVFM